jgi:hypothetical protein
MPTFMIDGQPVTMSEEWTAANTPQTAAEPVPQSITNYQARAVLRVRFLTAINEDLATGRTAAAVLPENDAQRIQADLAWQAWEQANNLERGSTLVALFAGQYGFDDAALDDLFRAAAQITA